MSGTYLLSAEGDLRGRATSGSDVRADARTQLARPCHRPAAAARLDAHGMGVDSEPRGVRAGRPSASSSTGTSTSCRRFRTARPPETIARMVAEPRDRGPRGAPGAELAEVELWEMPQYKVTYRP
jgi:hypothetical protein